MEPGAVQFDFATIYYRNVIAVTMVFEWQTGLFSNLAKIGAYRKVDPQRDIKVDYILHCSFQ